MAGRTGAGLLVLAAEGNTCTGWNEDIAKLALVVPTSSNCGTRTINGTRQGLPALEANDLFDKDSPFYYDWESLQLGGMVFGGLLCIAGFAMVLRSKCKCRNNQKASPLPEAATSLTPGSANIC